MKQLITNLTASGAPIFINELITPNTEQICQIWDRENLISSNRSETIWRIWNYVCQLHYKAERGDVWSFPFQTLYRGFGDCEDLSFALCSLLRHNNFLSIDEIFVHVGAYGRFRDGHAWCVLCEGSRWYVLETTLSQAPDEALEEVSPYYPYIRFNDVYSYELRPGFDITRKSKRNVGRKNKQIEEFWGVKVR